ncbi:hypothetical protein BMW23_1146 [Bodo saltans virus]|uniref:Uncharacterized protein n=1 Tax=Bodo saltans virus TaxID=2024608 RepID=A0A2H4UWK6_9VIRU|nr:hypothetical protein QJ851_gp1126 [Bodo saltans virus]ATZ81189.1 hypothetical protein BMW23_1146 [Bodo saltans virus]
MTLFLNYFIDYFFNYYCNNNTIQFNKFSIFYGILRKASWIFF